MADVVIGARLEVDDQGTGKVKNFKNELKLAQAEVITLTEKFGATSKEVAVAAQKAAELENKIGDSKKLIDAFNPDTKFRAFGASIQTVVGGFTALTGAMGLLGVESESVQKTLLKVQSALAISQGVAQLQEGIKSFQNLGLVIKAALGPVGIFLASVVAIGGALLAWFSRARDLTVAQKALNDTTKEYAQAAASAIEKVQEVKVAFDLARTGVISKKEALKIYNDTLGDSLGKTDSLIEAEKNLADKAEVYIKVTSLKAQANALFSKSAEAAVSATLVQKQLEKDLAEGLPAALASKVRKDIELMKSESKEIEKIGADLLRQAATQAKDAKVIFNPEINKQLIAEEKTANTARLNELKRAAAERLAQIKKDFEAETKARAGKITGKVGEGLLDQVGKSPEQLQAEAESKSRHDLRIEEEKDIDLFTRFKASNAAYLKQLDDEALERDQIAFNARQAMAGASVNILRGLSQLVGEQTAAGKILAIAGATIDTYAAIAATLKNAAKTPAGGIPGFAIAQAIATGIFGLLQVKRIMAVKVPGAGGGGGALPSLVAAAPLTPQRPGNTTTSLDQNSLNALGSATTRAFVVESDISNNQDRIQRLNRAARL